MPPTVFQRVSTRLMPGLFRLMASRKLGEVRGEGLEHIPREGPVLVAARHYHHLFDPVTALQVFPRDLHGVVALDWTTSPRGRRWMERLTHQARFPGVLRKEMLVSGEHGEPGNPESPYGPDDIPVYNERCFRQSVELLCEGRAVGIFPEGYPNVDPNFTLKRDLEEFLPFRSGFARIAEIAASLLGTPVPVVPLSFVYVPGSRWNALLRFGPPLMAPDPHGTAALVRATEDAVKKLSVPA